MHTVYTIPMLRLSVHSVHQCAPPISLKLAPSDVSRMVSFYGSACTRLAACAK